MKTRKFLRALVHTIFSSSDSYVLILLELLIRRGPTVVGLILRPSWVRISGKPNTPLRGALCVPPGRRGKGPRGLHKDHPCLVNSNPNIIIHLRITDGARA